MNNYFEELIVNNKLGIKDYKKFEEVSRLYTQGRALELEIKKPIQGNFDYRHLKDIHKYIFQDVFEWAGKDRAELGLLDFFGKSDGRGNITSFVPGALIQETANQIFTWLKEDNYLKNTKSLNEFAKGMAELITNINNLHPFREGNGRTQRIFLNELAKNAGYKLDLNLIPKEQTIRASIEAANGQTSRFERIILTNLRGFRQNLDLEQSKGLSLER